jgi:hypothetical protein
MVARSTASLDFMPVRGGIRSVGYRQSPERGLHWKVKEATMTMCLESNAFDNGSVTSAWLVLQKELVFKQRKVGRNPKEGLIEVEKYGDFED